MGMYHKVEKENLFYALLVKTHWVTVISSLQMKVQDSTLTKEQYLWKSDERDERENCNHP